MVALPSLFGLLRLHPAQQAGELLGFDPPLAQLTQGMIISLLLEFTGIVQLGQEHRRPQKYLGDVAYVSCDGQGQKGQQGILHQHAQAVPLHHVANLMSQHRQQFASC
ncbi:hypothetical protein DFAR_1050037 [Desulfarculales bacterium]